MAKTKFKIGDKVNFLYNKEDSFYFEENCEVTNSYHEIFLPSEKGYYYFLNPNGRIQYVHIHENYVFDVEDVAPKVLYGTNKG